MRKDLYQELYDLEDFYWWHIGKRLIVSYQINELRVNGLKGLKISDVGCGAGRWMEELEKIFPKNEVWGVDKEPEAISFCKKRGLKNLKIGLAEKLPFSDTHLDLLTCLDLLEHVSDDEKAISEFYRVLKQGGLLILSVPSYQKLFSYWDKMLDHKRRYSIGQIKNLLENQKFKVIKLTYTNFFVFLPSLLIRFLKSGQRRARQISDFMPVPNFFNFFLIFLYKIEAILLRRMDLPFGLSILVIARK